MIGAILGVAVFFGAMIGAILGVAVVRRSDVRLRVDFHALIFGGLDANHLGGLDAT